MDGNFAINGVVFNPEYIVEVDFSVEGHASISLANGNCRTLEGDDAARLRAFMDPAACELPPVEVETPEGGPVEETTKRKKK